MKGGCKKIILVSNMACCDRPDILTLPQQDPRWLFRESCRNCGSTHMIDNAQQQFFWKIPVVSCLQCDSGMAGTSSTNFPDPDSDASYACESCGFIMHIRIDSNSKITISNRIDLFTGVENLD